MLFVSYVFHQHAEKVICVLLHGFSNGKQRKIYFSQLFGSAFYRLQCIVAHVTFTNLKCNFTDRQIGNFQHCHIKAVNRTHKYVSVHANIYTKPLNNVSVSATPSYKHKYLSAKHPIRSTLGACAITLAISLFSLMSLLMPASF